MKNYLKWCKGLGAGLDLPMVGWQISIGHIGLPNVTVNSLYDNAYEDTFFEYFFSHVSEFIDAGFIGFLVGKGLMDDTDFSNETEGAVGDRGWFFGKLKAFDKGRPYLPTTQVQQSHPVIKRNDYCIALQNGGICISGSFPRKNRLSVDLFSAGGKKVACLYEDHPSGSSLFIPTRNQCISPGWYILRLNYGGIGESRGLIISK